MINSRWRNKNVSWISREPFFPSPFRLFFFFFSELIDVEKYFYYRETIEEEKKKTSFKFIREFRSTKGN